MDITTIIPDLTGQPPGEGAATDAPVDGDLAALFAAVLGAAAASSAPPAVPGVPGPTAPGDGERVVGDGEHPDLPIAARMGGEVAVWWKAPTGPAIPGQPDTAAVEVAGAESVPVAVPVDVPVVEGEPAPVGPPPTPGTSGTPGAPGPAVATGSAVVTSAAPGGVRPGNGSEPTPSAGGAHDAAAAPVVDLGPVAAPAVRPSDGEPSATPSTASAGSAVTPDVPAAWTNAHSAVADAPAALPPGGEGQLVERILEAVEALENAPPPRRIRLEVGDLRVAVSVRHDGVHVTVDGDSSPTPTWDSDLHTALEAKGLSLAGSDAGDDGARPDQQHAEQDPPPAGPPPPSRAAPRAGDADLRI